MRTLIALLLLQICIPIQHVGAQSASITSPLRVHSSNRRYFTDGTGRTIYLAGHQIAWDLQDHIWGEPYTINNQSTLDWNWYMAFMASHNFNYLRNWTVLSFGNGVEATDPGRYNATIPYRRTGPGTANDGRPKFDLKTFDANYFSRLRARLLDAQSKGIYVSIMLFDVFNFQNWTTADDWHSPWYGNVFHPNNNINNIANLDTMQNGHHSGMLFFYTGDSGIRQIQNDYVKRVVDTVYDLNNVFFEVANELENSQWQRDMIALIRSYEASYYPGHSHLILRSAGGYNLSGQWQTTDSATVIEAGDIFAPSAYWPAYSSDNMLANNTGKPGIWDNDHINFTSKDYTWPWRALTRGYHFSFYDRAFDLHLLNTSYPPDYDDSDWERLRVNTGKVLSYARRMNLANAAPQNTLSSSLYCLASAGNEYLVFNPGSASFSVGGLVAGQTYQMEWYDTVAETTSSGSFVADSNTKWFTPRSADNVLYLVRQGSGQGSGQASGSAVVNVSPTSVAPAGTITVSVTDPLATTQSWVGIYSVGGSSWLNWLTLNGTQNSPAAPITSATLAMPMPTSPGLYCVRYSNGQGVVAVSPNITVATDSQPVSSLIVSQTSVTPGGTVSVTVSDPSGAATDWVGLYAAGGSSYLAWQYLSGSNVAPLSPVSSAVLTFSMPTTPGQYELRLQYNNGPTVLATSVGVSVSSSAPSAAASLSVLPSSVSVGGNLAVQVVDAQALAGAWVGLYPVGGGPYVNWLYLNGTQTAPSSALTSAQFNMAGPMSPGQYYMVYNNGQGSLLQSSTITVSAALLSNSSVSVSSASAAPGGLVNVTVTDVAGEATDWLGLYAVGGSTYLSWQYLNGSIAVPPSSPIASATVSFQMPSTAGLYEFRLKYNNGPTLLATSPAVTVPATWGNGANAASTVTVSPTTVARGGSVNVSVSDSLATTGSWVGVYPVGGTSWLSWLFLNGTQTPPVTPLANATVTLTMPATAGQDHIRYNNGQGVVLSSQIISVQ